MTMHKKEGAWGWTAEHQNSRLDLQEHDRCPAWDTVSQTDTRSKQPGAYVHRLMKRLQDMQSGLGYAIRTQPRRHTECCSAADS